MVVCVLSCYSPVQLFATPWTIAHQAPLSMGFSRQEYWSGLPCPSPGDLPDPGIEPEFPTSSALAGRSLTPSTTWVSHLFFFRERNKVKQKEFWTFYWQGAPIFLCPLRNDLIGTSLEVQWLRLHLPIQEAWVPSLVMISRSHMPHSQKSKTQNRINIVTNSIKILKMVHIKRNDLIVIT